MRGEEPQQGTKIHKGRNMLAGGIAGCCAKTFVAPLDRLKILLQARHIKYYDQGVWQGLQSIYRNEGARGFFKGNGVQMLRVFPYAGVQFFVYEHAKQVLPEHIGHNKFNSLLAGSLAGISAVAATYPLDLLRTRLAVQVEERRYLGIVHAIKTIYAQEGFFAFFKGIRPTIMGIIPYGGLSFFTFDTLKHQLLKIEVLRRKDTTQPTLIVAGNLVCGGLAGAISQTAAYPLDVVRRRMQIDSTAKNQVSPFKGTVHLLQVIAKESGILRGWFRGLSINYIREVPQVGVAFAVYEYMKAVLHTHERIDRV